MAFWHKGIPGHYSTISWHTKVVCCYNYAMKVVKSLIWPKTALIRELCDRSHSHTAAVSLDYRLTSSSGSKVMVSMSTGDSSLPLMGARINWISQCGHCIKAGYIHKLDTDTKGCFNAAEKTHSYAMHSCRLADCSVSQPGLLMMTLHYNWLVSGMWLCWRCHDLLVVAGWLGSTSPLILLLLVSSSPDSSDSPLRSTAVSRQRGA